MATNWTNEQQQALAPTDRLTVVSAAAGSGKTTVLVEYVIRRLLDENTPVTADKFLIATFSNASAKEFKNRIEKSLGDLIKKSPSNLFLKKQKTALQRADISTIHSFCIKLVRENFQTLAIRPDFTICDDAQSLTIHNLAIEQAMLYGYTLPHFKEFVSFYGKSSQDGMVREFLRKMDYFFSALPHPVLRAENMRDEYLNCDKLTDSIWYHSTIKDLSLKIEYLNTLAQRMQSLYDIGDFEGYEEGINIANSLASGMLVAIKSGDIEQLKNLTSISLSPIGRAKPACDISKGINEFLYGSFKTILSEIKESLAFLTQENFTDNLALTKPYVNVLIEVFKRYQEILFKIKKERNCFEFSDFEHLALSLLQKEDGTRTNLAQSLSEHYFCILEDEFQDTSFVQDAIFSLIAKDNQSNLYVVGDVKQSIYGFRKASPEIFLNKRQIGIDNPQKGNTIFLSHNFRSSKEVIDGINVIFNNIMTPLVGGVDYKASEYLQTFRTSEPDKKSVKINIYEDNEIQNIAQLIHDMISSGYTIPDKNGPRPVTQSDFCILIRKNSKALEFKKALEHFGYNSFIKDNQLILEKTEVESIISLLRVISNPLNDVHITAGMFGDLIGFTLDEIFKIKKNGNKDNIYQALAVSDNPKALKFLELLKEFTWISNAYSVDKLIELICSKTGYYYSLSLKENSAITRENVRWFINFAKDYAKGNHDSLAGFIRYIDNYLESGKNNSSASSSLEDSVNIMTMHTAKGLEFPICIVASLTSPFNSFDFQEKLFLDTELGVGMYANTSFGYNNSTLAINSIKNKIYQTRADEEMRLLYVAFTRAKELLILSGEFNHRFTNNTIKRIAFTTATPPHPYHLRHTSTPMEWILTSCINHNFFTDEYSFITPSYETNTIIDISFNQSINLANKEVQIEKQQVPIDFEKLSQNLSYVYPHLNKTRLPIKVSVSEISKSHSYKQLQTPSFINKDKVTASQKGTAMHKFVQYCNIQNARDDFEKEIVRIESLINPKLLNLTQLKNFINSPLADLILQSDEQINEQDFLMPYDAYLALGDESFKGQELVVQGVIDCVLKTDNTIIVIDYKTDNINDISQLKQLYSKQLSLYSTAAKLLYKSENVRSIIYSFKLNQYIEL